MAFSLVHESLLNACAPEGAEQVRVARKATQAGKIGPPRPLPESRPTAPLRAVDGPRTTPRALIGSLPGAGVHSTPVLSVPRIPNWTGVHSTPVLSVPRTPNWHTVGTPGGPNWHMRRQSELTLGARNSLMGLRRTRSERDSNPRDELTPSTAFPVRRPRPARRSLRSDSTVGLLSPPPGARRTAGYTRSAPRRGVRVVDGAALEKRCGDEPPWVRIPPSPVCHVSGHSGHLSSGHG